MSDSSGNHLAVLGLQRNPFPPTPDAQSYFYTAKLEREFSEALHCVLAHKGIVLLAGEVGLGKSTFVRRMLDECADKNVVYALILNTFLQGPALLQAINRDFGITASGELAADLASLNEFLLQQRREERTCLLVIDDAQNLDLQSLELVRLLTNLETGQEKLLQIVLAGQPELLDVLAKPEIRQLTSRIVAHVSLQALSRDELLRYFEFRVSQAGAAGRVRLSVRALALLHKLSAGNPRRVHLILDRCLYGLVASRSSEIDDRLIKAAASEVDFNRCARSGRGGKRSIWQALAGLSLAASMALGVSFAMQSGSSREAAPPSRAEKPLAAAVAPALDLGRCVQRLQGAAGSGASFKVSRLPEHLRTLLEEDGQTCFYQQGQEAWVAWLPTGSSLSLAEHFPSPAVIAVQKRLAEWGLFDVQNADGWFGPQTKKALARFQVLSGYGKDGEPDDLSLFLLEKLNMNKLKTEHAGVSRG